jgi:asparagine synthase (glutamine-hydrolysing)
VCGINAIYAFDRNGSGIDPDELLRTREAMRTRGPDAAGMWIGDDRRVGLGHRRLSIIDVGERANQPMRIGDCVIVFNGEIYDFAELRDGLDEPFLTTSDTEVVLRLFIKYGEAMLPRLRGMFALAIWDGRSLFLARDPYGIKPLYYANDGRVVRVASQVKALLAGGGVSRAHDPAGIAGFLLRGFVPEPFTTYEAIRSLPAGSWMRVDANGASEPHAYFSIAQTWREAVHAQPAISIADALRESVRYHLVSDVPVGAFLSAGRDSSTVVALARETGTAINTMTLLFDVYRGTSLDEGELAAKVARHYGASHETAIVTRDEFLAELPRALDAMDLPSIDGLNSYFICRAAAQRGWKVALCGTGGDELFGGYSTFCAIPRFVRLFGIFRHFPGIARAYERAHRRIVPRSARFSPKSAQTLTYCHSYEGAYLLKRGLFLPDELPALLGDDVAHEGLQRLALLDHIRDAITPDPGNAFARIATLESALLLRSQLLRDIDWASMAHSIEVRVPLVDAFLLRQIAPALLRTRDGKEQMASAPHKALPVEVLARKKTGFKAPVREWITSETMFGQREWALELVDGVISDVSDQ